MPDRYDVSLEDGELLLEVELCTDLMIAGSECAADHLPQDQIDAILGVASSLPRPGGSKAKAEEGHADMGGQREQPPALEEVQPEGPVADAETLREARWAAQLIKAAAQSDVDRLAPELIDDILEVPDPKSRRE